LTRQVAKILIDQYITREVNADIVVLENETLFDSRKFKNMGDLGSTIFKMNFTTPKKLKLFIQRQGSLNLKSITITMKKIFPDMITQKELLRIVSIILST
jgi:hypothetical protein